ncbi:hypothetical protein GWK48_00345 [Metallosphaera tengchongensis]|uniref:Uncharacterized protein n=1 Tax=Metallosphaera tengchongensis TaxID=1532350 RepID=A0A6N0NSH7_9CREN|nr:hypothetical protein [Metallosphaera tengchongensis]QKQ99046.1 hypothetical protein GWK48_00345 [Metallosphaera tengchongensis]
MDCTGSILSLSEKVEECFYDRSHYLKYRLALSIKVNAFPLEGFLYVETKDPNIDFVIGFSERAFIKEIDKDCVKFERDLRKCLGFDHLYSDAKFQQGKRIYFPDLILEVVKVFTGEEIREYLKEEVKNYEMKDYATLEGVETFSNPYIEFVSKLRDKDLEELVSISSIYRLLNNVRDRMMDYDQKFEEFFREMEDRVIDIASRRGIPLDRGRAVTYDRDRIYEDEEHIGEINEPLNINSILSRVRGQLVTDRIKEFQDYVLGKVRDNEVTLGKYLIAFRGVVLDNFENRSLTVLLLERQQVLLKTRENEFHFNVEGPSVLLFKTSQGKIEVVR